MRVILVRFLALGILVSTGFAQQGMIDPMGIGRRVQTAAVALVGIPDVKKELKLTGAQGKSVEAVRKAHEKGMGAFAKSMGSDPGAAMAKIKEFEAAIDKADADIRAELQPEQAARLRALQYQAMGMKALYEKDLQKALGLSPEQAAKLDALKAGESSRMMDLFGSGIDPRDPNGMQKKIKEFREAGAKAILSNLTAEQEAKYREALGVPLKVLTQISEAGL